MKNKFLNIGGERRGSALLVALVFTGLLILVTIGVSTLISRETRTIRGVLDGTRAFYAAEAGIELALLDVQENDPGFEENTETLKIGDDPLEKVRYQIKAITNRIPILADYELDLIRNKVINERAGFAELKLNESIKIPFRDDIGDFVVDYYYPLSGFLQSSQLNQFDILRFKLFGKDMVTGQIDSINEFVPASDQTRSKGTSADNPVSLGPNGDWNAGTFFPSSFEAIAQESAGQSMTFREFLSTHEKNYLILTNFLDPSKLDGVDLEERDAASIYYRIRDLDNANDLAGKGNLVSPAAKIISIGENEGLERKLEVEVAPDNFLPIFDFALYRPTLR